MDWADRPELIIMRGLPGSGKSTYAKSYVDYVYCSMDQFFVKNGVYTYDPKKVFPAVKYCEGKFKKAVKDKKNVIVDNTNLTPKEYQKYIDIALENDYRVNIVSIIGLTAEQSFQFNTHGVPLEKCQQMEKKYNPFEYKEEYGNLVYECEIDYLQLRVYNWYSFDIVDYRGENIILIRDFVVSEKSDIKDFNVKMDGEYLACMKGIFYPSAKGYYKQNGSVIEQITYSDIADIVKSELVSEESEFCMSWFGS